MGSNSYSTNALKRWSCSDNELPTVDKIKAIHVYDFDNTLFASPLPSKQLWQGPTIGLLQSQTNFTQGGWWHDSNILKCTGEGEEVEEPRAWRGWWNEQIVELVDLSMEQKDALTVLLTGRSESGFAEIIQKMVRSKRLEFDMIVLRPEVGPANEQFPSTMKFKQAFLEALVYTYNEADEIRVYEDRPRHVQGFRDFFATMNQTLQAISSAADRKPIRAEVIEVAEKATNLDPVTECAEVQKLINSHNMAFREGSLPEGSKSWEIKKTVFFTGYLISPADSDRLLKAAGLPTSSANSPSSDVRTLANSILITPRPCPPHILEKVGGIGKKFRWRAVAIGSLDNTVYAARVEPVPSTERFYSENQVPMVVLALRGTGRPVEANHIQNWQPLPADKAIEFESVVGEKVTLRIEPEQPKQDTQGRGFKRSRNDDEFPALGRPAQQHPGSNAQRMPPTQPQGQGGQKRSFHSGENRRPNGNAGQKFGGGGRGGGGGGGQGRNNFQRGRGGGADGKGRGRGGYPGYRSLDDEARKKANFGTDGANDEGLSY